MVVVVVGGGRLGAQGQINGAREGGYKRALIKKPSRARCPFFPEGQKVMGEKKKEGSKGVGEAIPPDLSQVSGIVRGRRLADTSRTRPKYDCKVSP